MRSCRMGVLVPFLLFATSLWARQASSTTTQSASDPQGVAIVQTAITALGGATAIGEAQSWTFQAQMQGPHANGTVSYLISTNADTGSFLGANGTTKPAAAIHSHLVPALAGAILLNESKNPQFTILNGGTSTLDSQPVSVVTFAIGPQNIPAQVWYFNPAGLPVLIDFRLPAVIGARLSFPFVVALSDYKSVAGVSYPFSIVSFVPGKPRELVTLQSIAPGTAAPTNEFNGQAGDLR